MRQIPGFAAIAVGQAGEHELRAHRAIANQPAFAQRFQKCFFHKNQAEDIIPNVTGRNYFPNHGGLSIRATHKRMEKRMVQSQPSCRGEWQFPDGNEFKPAGVQVKIQ